MNLPGVVTMMWAPLLVYSLISCAIVLAPPIKTKWVSCGIFWRNFVRTSSICDASSRVGEMISAPTSCFLSGVDRLSRISSMGIRKAKVFPEPVTASAHTSFFWRSNGMQAAYRKIYNNYYKDGWQLVSQFWKEEDCTCTGVVSLKSSSLSVLRTGSLKLTLSLFHPFSIFYTHTHETY